MAILIADNNYRSKQMLQSTNRIFGFDKESFKKLIKHIVDSYYFKFGSLIFQQ